MEHSLTTQVKIYWNFKNITFVKHSVTHNTNFSSILANTIWLIHLIEKLWFFSNKNIFKMYTVCMYMRFVTKVSDPIYLCATWECNISLMYIDEFVMALAIFVSSGLIESVVSYCLSYMVNVVMFYNLVMFVMQKSIE